MCGRTIKPTGFPGAVDVVSTILALINWALDGRPILFPEPLGWEHMEPIASRQRRGHRQLLRAESERSDRKERFRAMTEIG
jgi:hypothetical protein